MTTFPHPCCLHEIQKHSYRVGNEGGMSISFRCCHCGALTVKKYVTGPDPDHGPWGPKILYEEAKV